MKKIKDGSFCIIPQKLHLENEGIHIKAIFPKCVLSTHDDEPNTEPYHEYWETGKCYQMAFCILDQLEDTEKVFCTARVMMMRAYWEGMVKDLDNAARIANQRRDEFKKSQHDPFADGTCWEGLI